MGAEAQTIRKWINVCSILSKKLKKN